MIVFTALGTVEVAVKVEVELEVVGVVEVGAELEVEVEGEAEAELVMLGGALIARHEQADETLAGIPLHWEMYVGISAGAVRVAVVYVVQNGAMMDEDRSI